MLQIDLWKRVLIILTCVAGLYLALPNAFYGPVEQHNDALKAIDVAGSTPELEAQADLWPEWLPERLVNLGLDLRGGAHLLAEVNVADVYASRMEATWPEVRDALRSITPVRRVEAPEGELRVRINDTDKMAQALEVARGLARPVQTITGAGANDIVVSGAEDILTLTLSDAEKQATDERTMQQSLEIIRRRIDEVGTREPTIQRQGSDRILIQVPGIGSASELKAIIGTTAQLTFNPVVNRGADANAAPGLGNSLLPDAEAPGVFYIIETAPVVTGEELVDAQPSFDQNGRPAVSFRFDTTGARKFGTYTAENIGAPFAIVLDDAVISAPTIQSAIPGGSGIITGNFSVEESTNLAVLLRAGALPAGLTFSKNAPSGQSWARTASTRADRHDRRLCRRTVFHVGDLRAVRFLCQRCAGRERRHDLRASQPDRSHADPAGHRRDRFDCGHGGGRQRADLRTHQGRTENRKGSGPRNQPWL
ncbi:protein-export membrane protein SecD [Roseobacter sp. GAI101]|nr:protein-export membrane protein SecD [Roseobacter sp. GAI101]